jgi:hypothetical protein
MATPLIIVIVAAIFAVEVAVGAVLERPTSREGVFTFDLHGDGRD